MIFDLFHICTVLVESVLQKRSFILAINGGYKTDGEEQI